MNTKNNRRASNKLGRRDDPKLYNMKCNKKEGDKPTTNKKPKEDKMDQILNLLNNLKPLDRNANKTNTNDRSQSSNNFSRQNRFYKFPCNT